MSDDWQEAAFSNRHTHNRNSKPGSKGSKTNSHGFNIQKTFGSYEIKSPKFPSSQLDGEKRAARLEIYIVNEAGNALVGELSIPGCLSANLLMAGSRKVMKNVIRDLVLKTENDFDEDEADIDEEEGRPEQGEEESQPMDDDEDDDNSPEEERRNPARSFEKNSFRSPKFWLKWQGHLLSSTSQGDEDLVTDEGYIVFSGNSCEKFDGTLSCAELGWKNVKITGWKIKGLAARDFEMRWFGQNEKVEKDKGEEERKD